ncbi:hypothetical protein DNTS_002013 [Danionella cerebrum]|uniref:SH3 domain-containing protein n=1 Tax=Danionella cerebrum TaxID=2873325 RepID=A0A553RB39_9TELE|nr:hypothetical protein DNTS_002013 [Danionella translucida]
MDSKSDVKTMMARFQSGGGSMEVNPGVRPKPLAQPMLSSGPPVALKKPTLENSLSGGANATLTSPKPNFLKNTVHTARSTPEMHNLPKPTSFGTRFENTTENQANFKVPVKPKPSDSSMDPETQKFPFPKAPLQKPPSSIFGNDSKVISAKPLTPKPPWFKDIPKSEDNSPAAPKLPSTPKPKSTITMYRQQLDENNKVESPTSPISLVKPPSLHGKDGLKRLQEGVKEGAKTSSAIESVSKPAVLNKPSIQRKSSGPFVQAENDDPSAPKRKTLPNTFALGSAPAKPNRPPKINLEKFKKGSEAVTESAGTKNATPPPPPPSHPSSQTASPLHSQPLPPSLPPRPPGAVIQDENYDDVESLRGTEFVICEKMVYDFLHQRTTPSEASQPSKKQDKDREKKEKDAIKKFKITPPLQVLHQVKARADYKGGKLDLSLKKGESIDIVRITENPEGKWLGRTQDGSCKTYKITSMNVQRVVLPPPPPGDDVYDDPDSNQINIPPPPQFTSEGNKETQYIYDDVDSFPPAPSPSSIPRMQKLPKVQEDPKKQKKFEKEEKDFRKKFKYDSEIHVLHQATITSTKKGSGKDLAVQAGEIVDVISKSDPEKLICRNKEGKFGYVSESNIQVNDEVYDDIGDDCIYDND